MCGGACRSRYPRAPTPTSSTLGQKNDPTGTCRERYVATGAIDVATLETELGQHRHDITAAEERLADLDANLGEWQEILELAATFAVRCGDAYRKASDRTRKQFNAAVFERLDVKDGRLSGEEYRRPSTTASA